MDQRESFSSDLWPGILTCGQGYKDNYMTYFNHLEVSY